MFTASHIQQSEQLKSSISNREESMQEININQKLSHLAQFTSHLKTAT